MVQWVLIWWEFTASKAIQPSVEIISHNEKKMFDITKIPLERTSNALGFKVFKSFKEFFYSLNGASLDLMGNFDSKV